jgi:DNA-binding winged helix-turn-helix (wHTH) protein
MTESGDRSRVVRFAAFEFDPGTGELRKNGLRIKLNGQPVSVLAMLIERAGEVVTREELQKRLWPVDTYVDFEHSLNAAIKRLRAALRDSAGAPRFVETLPRQGYRFIAPLSHLPVDQPAVQPVQSQSANVVPQADAGNQKPTRWWRYVLVLAVGAALLIGAILRIHVTEYFWRSPIADARVQTVTDFDGVQQDAAVSRDGHFVAFLSDRSGQMDVWVTQVGSGQFHNLTNGNVPELVNPSIRTLEFSPDGSFIAFWVRKQVRPPVATGLNRL